MKNIYKHPYHIVTNSPWPFITSFFLFFFALGFAMILHDYNGGKSLMYLGFFGILFSIFTWCRDIIREGIYEGTHTKLVELGLKKGVIIFLIAETMTFGGFSLSFFYSALSPSYTLGSIWPPLGVNSINPWSIPLLNTIILLTSGATITLAHHALILGKRLYTIYSLFITCILATIFTLLQIIEYFESNFSMSDGIYGSIFFLLTGFHGLHVIIGTFLIFICILRTISYHFTKQSFFGLEISIWYWHFVDIIWLFIFVSIYWWGGK